MSRRCHDLVRQAKSSRLKYVYSSLVDIRKNFIKNTKGVETLVAAGLVQRILELLRTRDSLENDYRSKVIDLSISILGNMCMEEITRKQVIKNYGVATVVELLIESESQSLQNRSCRCLANILLSPSSWELAHSTSVIERITKLLQDSDNEESQQTCIRAIRLLGQTGGHVQKLVDQNSISAVLKHIDSKTEAVNQSALRCLHSLSVHGCTPQFASQAISSGKVAHLLALTRTTNTEAFQLLVRFSNHHNFRPEFGNIGGISILVELFKSEDVSYEAMKSEILSVLCLCCKEAVNRVKLREEGALVIFLETLSQERFYNLHTRIISALVSFLYDQPSFDVLLEHGLVPTLVKQLNDYFQCKSEGDQEDACELVETGQDETIDACELVDIGQDETTNVCELVKIGQGKTSDACELVEMEQDETIDKTEESQTCETAGKDQKTMARVADTGAEHVDAFCEITDLKTDDSEEADILHNEKESGESIEIKHGDRRDSATSPDDKGYQCQSQEKFGNISGSRPVYSIDSPTYESVSEWNDEEYNDGVKCIEHFTPPPPVDWSAAKSYSPISNISYYSPSEGSPEYSLETTQSGYSPDTSLYKSSQQSAASLNCRLGYSPEPGTQSPPRVNRSNCRHKYTGVNCRIYNTSLSPASSPERGTENSPQRPSGSRRCSFSSNDSVTEFDALSPVSLIRTPETSNEFTEEYQYSPVTSPAQNENDAAGNTETSVAQNEGDTDGNTEKPIVKRKLSIVGKVTTAENPDACIEGNKGELKLPRKNIRKRKKVSSTSNVFENNILILLSRVSQMTNPTMHLVTKEVVHCLLDYISTMEAPLARAARLLSRVFRNPLCFQKLLSLNIPLIIYEKLIENEDMKSLTSNRFTKPNSKLRSPILSHQAADCSPDSDRFSMTDESVTEEEQWPSKRQRQTSESGEARKTQTIKGEIHKQEAEVCVSGKCGIAFLEDLSGIADTQYGRGTVERLLVTCDENQRQAISLSLSFIVWTAASRQYYFNHQEVFDQLINIFKDKKNRMSFQFCTAIKGLSFLAKITDTKSKYQVKKTNTALHARRKSVASKEAKSNVLIVNDNGKESANISKTFHCLVESLGDQTDTVFLVEGEKIFAKRSILSKESEIFAAMLEGNYSEASLSEIPIPQTSKFAFEYLIHYLHDCTTENCEVMLSLHTATVTKNSAEECIQVLIEADKFLLQPLQKVASDCLFTRYIIPESALPVVKYAVLHGCEVYQKAAISSVLVDTDCDSNMIKYICEFLDSEYADVFLHSLTDIFTE